MLHRYQVIPRKYRPKLFKNVVGQKETVITIQNALKQGRTAQAYLFCGERGTGKTTLARLLAKALNCSALSEECEPCNICTSCTEINKGLSLNVIEIDGASNRGIDNIRQINESLGYSPAHEGYKIYIIDEVHMLTKEAFNALLKTLEEPPERVKFLFATTEAHKVPLTILSRCQRFSLTRISDKEIFSKLDWIAKDLHIQVEEKALQLLCEQADGSLRDAESLFDQIVCYAEGVIKEEDIKTILGTVTKELFFTLDKGAKEKDLSIAFSLAQTVLSQGGELSYFLNTLLSHFQTILLTHLNPKETTLTFSSSMEKENYEKAITIYTQEQCLTIINFIIEWLQKPTTTLSKKITLEAIFLHIIQTPHRISLEQLTKRLCSLEEKIIAASKEEKEPPNVEEKTHAPVKAIEEPPSKPEVKEKITKEPPPPEQSAPKKRFETLLQFAAIELEGTLKKEV